MTASEIALCTLCAAVLVGRYASFLNETAALSAAALIAALAIAHLFLVPYRWQMAPAYAVVAALILTTLFGGVDGLARHAGFATGALLLVLAAALAAGMPMRRLPAPSGPFSVGVVETSLARAVENTEQGRELRLTVWYPAAQDSAPQSAPKTRANLWPELYEDSRTPALMRALTLYLRNVRTHAVRGGAYNPDAVEAPTLIYNHALISFAAENTLLMEHLASEGFIVIGVRHAGQLAERADIDAQIPPAERARDRELQAQLRIATDRAERARLSAEMFANATGAPEIVARRAADVRHVVDHLEEVLVAIPGGPAAPATAYGALGLSLGGATSTRACLDDARCVAAANLDGGLFGAAPGASLGAPKPYLMLYSAQNAGTNDLALRNGAFDVEERVISGTKHLDLHDAAVVLPGLKWLGALGPARGVKTAQTRNQAISTFFARALSSTRP